MSGLSRTPGKRVWVYPHRGFESRPFRQQANEHGALQSIRFGYPHFYPPFGICLKAKVCGER